MRRRLCQLAEIHSLTEQRAFGSVSVKKEAIASTLSKIQSFAAPAADLMPSQSPIQKFRKASDFFHSTTKAATSAVMTMMIRVIGLASIAAFKSHCPAVTSLDPRNHAFIAPPIAVMFCTRPASARPASATPSPEISGSSLFTQLKNSPIPLPILDKPVITTGRISFARKEKPL